MQPPIRRTRLGLSGIIAGLALAVTGCATGGTTGQATGDDPALLLRSSAEAIGDQTYRMEMTVGALMTATGSVDPATGAGEMTMTFTQGGTGLEIRIVFTEADMWMNAGELGELLGAGTPWMHVDLSRLGPDGFMGIEPGAADPSGATRLLRGLDDVRQIDDHTFEGEIDLTGASTAMLDERSLAMLGEDSVPFTATIDDQDRLTHLSVDFPQVEGAEGLVDTVEVRLSDFGAPVEITPPPADQVSPVPEELYELLDM